MSAQEGEILRLVNDERRRGGRRRLNPRNAWCWPRADTATTWRCATTSATTVRGDTPAERVRGVGIDAATLGENIYLDRDPDYAKLAERTVKEWLNSAEYRAKMLSPDFATTGVGIARAADGAATSRKTLRSSPKTPPKLARILSSGPGAGDTLSAKRL